MESPAAPDAFWTLLRGVKLVVTPAEQERIAGPASCPGPAPSCSVGGLRALGEVAPLAPPGPGRWTPPTQGLSPGRPGCGPCLAGAGRGLGVWAWPWVQVARPGSVALGRPCRSREHSGRHGARGHGPESTVPSPLPLSPRGHCCPVAVFTRRHSRGHADRGTYTFRGSAYSWPHACTHVGTRTPHTHAHIRLHTRSHSATHAGARSRSAPADMHACRGPCTSIRSGRNRVVRCHICVPQKGRSVTRNISLALRPARSSSCTAHGTCPSPWEAFPGFVRHNHRLLRRFPGSCEQPGARGMPSGSPAPDVELGSRWLLSEEQAAMTFAPSDSSVGDPLRGLGSNSWKKCCLRSTWRERSLAGRNRWQETGEREGGHAVPGILSAQPCQGQGHSLGEGTGGGRRAAGDRVGAGTETRGRGSTRWKGARWTS